MGARLSHAAPNCPVVAPACANPCGPHPAPFSACRLYPLWNYPRRGAFCAIGFRSHPARDQPPVFNVQILAPLVLAPLDPHFRPYSRPVSSGLSALAFDSGLSLMGVLFPLIGCRRHPARDSRPGCSVPPRFLRVAFTLHGITLRGRFPSSATAGNQRRTRDLNAPYSRFRRAAFPLHGFPPDDTHFRALSSPVFSEVLGPCF